MKELAETVEDLQAKLEAFRKKDIKLNEIQTRNIFIRPILESLGWDVANPDQALEECPAFGAKSIDYALKLNDKFVLLIEAKPLDDPLGDGAIAQVIGYAANAGIAWCILTNGLRWKVYQILKGCPAPEMLLFEVSLDPRDAGAKSPQQLAQRMSLFSNEGMANQKLDEIGRDGNVLKAMDLFMADPPNTFINLVKAKAPGHDLAHSHVRESLKRIWASLRHSGASEEGPAQPENKKGPVTKPHTAGPPPGASGKHGKKGDFEESSHLQGKPQEVADLFTALKTFCLSTRPGDVNELVRKMFISFRVGQTAFCDVVVQKKALRVYLYLDYSDLKKPPLFGRDVSKVGRWSPGTLELAIRQGSELKESEPLIQQSQDGRC